MLSYLPQLECYIGILLSVIACILLCYKKDVTVLSFHVTTCVCVKLSEPRHCECDVNTMSHSILAWTSIGKEFGPGGGSPLECGRKGLIILSVHSVSGQPWVSQMP